MPTTQQFTTMAEDIEKDPARKARLNKEIEFVGQGRAAGIPVEFDPLTAYHVAVNLDLALHHPAGMPPQVAQSLEELVDGLQSRISEQCPELAQLLADCRQQRRDLERKTSHHG